MELKYTTGCVCTVLEINGNPTYKMKPKTLQKHIKRAVEKVTDTGTLESILTTIARSAGTYKYIGHCAQCGDNIEEYTLKF